jgi:hypothetical protein
MSGEPVLDFWSSILFALGFIYALYHWRRLRYCVLFVVFFGFMCASIFSLEAPQSHRAFGMIFVAFLFIAAFLDRMRRLLQSIFGPRGVHAGSVALALALIPIGNTNYHKYFDTEPAFDSNCTMAARYMGTQWPRAHHYVMSAYLWMGHPPFEFYAPNVEGGFYYQLSQAVPVVNQKNQDALFTTILEYPPVLETIRWFYPQGTYAEESHPKYGLMFRAWGVKNEDIQAKAGLTARYFDNTVWQGKPVFERKEPKLDLSLTPDTWPLPGPGSVVWQGSLYIPHEGRYSFYAKSDDPFELEIGGRLQLQTSGGQEVEKTLWMAGGLHRLHARAQHLGPRGRVVLSWQSLGRSILYNLPAAMKNIQKQPIPAHYFFTYPKPIGLLETLYNNADWTGEPLRQFVEPLPFFAWFGTPHGFPGPLSYTWRGWITLPQDGLYRFEIAHSGYADLQIAGRWILREGSTNAMQALIPAGAKIENPIGLQAGTYPVSMRLSATGGWNFKWSWTKPDGKTEVVPGWVLAPAEEE